MIKVIVDCWTLRRIAKESDENYLVLLEIAGDKIPSLEDAKAGNGYNNFEGIVNNITDLPDFIVEHAKFEVLRPMKLLRENAMRVTKQNVSELFSSAQVHLPGNELMKIKSVRVEEDCCTNEIQELINKGWVILAICPQLTRRPDYILGQP